MDMICLLCHHHDADNTGFHILPSFLMRRIIDDEKREHEVGSEVKSGIVTLFGEKVI